MFLGLTFHDDYKTFPINIFQNTGLLALDIRKSSSPEMTTFINATYLICFELFTWLSYKHILC